MRVVFRNPLSDFEPKISYSEENSLPKALKCSLVHIQILNDYLDTVKLDWPNSNSMKLDSPKLFSNTEYRKMYGKYI